MEPQGFIFFQKMTYSQIFIVILLLFSIMLIFYPCKEKDSGEWNLFENNSKLESIK